MVMPPEEIEGYRLSRQQAAVWCAGAAETGGVHVTVALDGPLAPAALGTALRQLVTAHEVLRTTFHQRPGMPLPSQVVSDVAGMAWEVTDLRDQAADRRRAAVDAAIARLTREPFDLAAGPLLRAGLFLLGDDTALLHLGLSTLVADEATACLLVGALADCYRTRAASRAPATRNVRFTGRQPAAGVDPDGSRYWQEHLAGMPTGPVGLALFASQRSDALSRRELAADLVRELDVLADALAVAPVAVLLTAWHVVLARFTDAPEIVIDTAFDGRRADQRSAFGPCTHQLPVRLGYDAGLRFDRAVRRCAHVLSAHRTWQDVAPVDGPRAIGYTFGWLDLPSETVADGVTFRVEAVRSAPVAEALRLSVRRTGAELTMIAESAVVSHAELDSLLDSCLVFLRAALAGPDTGSGALPLLGPERERALLAGFNATARTWPDRVESFPELFAAQVLRTPHAVAVSSQDGTVGYAELARRSARLAAHLHSLGVRVGDPVALCPRSPLPTLSVLVGLLAILRAGAVYVPVDPADPPDRRLRVLAGLGVSVVLIDQPVEHTLASFGADAHVVELGRTDHPSDPDTWSNPDLTGTNAAYVIHTSGSTGTPKGVVVEHASLLNYLRWVNAELIGDVVLPAVTRPTFDASLKQLLAPLIRGGRVWLLPQDALNDPDALYEAMCRQAETGDALGFNCVPSLWDALLTIFESMPDTVLPNALRRVLLGGEALPESLVARTSAVLPNTEVWNLYGPTEGTANATVGRAVAGAPVTIGRPLANTQAFVLDREMRPVPVGARGQLYLGGAGVARGYAGRARETADRFRPNPLGELLGSPGSRIYHTGDLARYRASGEIEYLGRDDLQVKVRGFRIELADVEAVLGSSPGVREAAATVVETLSGTRRLVGFVVPAAGIPFIGKQVRAHLAGRLPDHAVPTHLVAVDALPRTSTGKLDRPALAGLVDV